MQIKSITAISSELYSVSGVSAFRRQPNYKTNTVTKRHCSGFLYVEAGECIYRWENGSVHLKPGALLYVPHESVHSMEVLGEGYAIAVVNFTLCDRVGEEIVFASRPLLVTEHLGAACVKYLYDLCESFSESVDHFKCVAHFCLFFSELCAEMNLKKCKVSPAMQYIREHLVEGVEGERLADACSLSVAQMYRLFLKETGMTPTAYRNKLRIEKACQMLVTFEYNVSEIAQQLGFENVSYFNRLFKTQTGMSPRAYLKRG